MSEVKLKNFLEFLREKDERVCCVINSEKELSAVVDALKTICQVEDSKKFTLRTRDIDKAERKFPMNLRIKPLKEYVIPRSFQTVLPGEYPWKVLEKMNIWSSTNYQQFYYGVDLDIGDSIITSEFFVEYKNEDVDSTVAEYKQSLR